MKLLINTIIYNNRYPPLYEAFLQSLVCAIVQSREDTNIIMLCEAKHGSIVYNDRINIITPLLTQRLFKKSIYKNQLKSILKIERPSTIWHIDIDMTGFYTIPYCFLLSNHLGVFTKKKEKQLLCFSTISNILTDDEKIQQQFLHIPKIKYWLAPPHKAFRQLTWEQKIQACETYAHGHAYFHLCAEQLTELAIVECLKAFSTFKQWQKSQMKLIITTKQISHHFSTLLQSYKFKQDVLLLPYSSIEDLATITTASYATLYSTSTDFLGWYTTSCAAARVLTITTRAIPLHENATLTCIWNHTCLSKAMITLYKDEQLQQKINEAQALLLSNLVFSSSL